jgi:hypothetical protein
MNRLRLVFILFFGLSSCLSFSQQGYLFVKKGYHKKLTYVEGDPIHVKLQDGSRVKGYITLLRNDSVFINGGGIPRPAITEILLDPDLKQPFSTGGKNALIVVGVATLTTVGLLVTKQAKEEKALVAGMIAGVAALLIKHFGTRLGLFTRKKYKIGKKFHLQVLEFHITPSRQKAF